MLPGHAPVRAIFSIVFPKRGRSTERHALDLTNTCMSEWDFFGKS